MIMTEMEYDWILESLDKIQSCRNLPKEAGKETERIRYLLAVGQKRVETSMECNGCGHDRENGSRKSKERTNALTGAVARIFQSIEAGTEDEIPVSFYTNVFQVLKQTLEGTDGMNDLESILQDALDLYPEYEDEKKMTDTDEVPDKTADGISLPKQDRPGMSSIIKHWNELSETVDSLYEDLQSLAMSQSEKEPLFRQGREGSTQDNLTDHSDLWIFS